MTYIKILLLIILFDPNNENLMPHEKGQIIKLQNKYVTLFHAYMCDNFGVTKGVITFKSILYEMNKVNDLAQWFEQTVAEKSNYEYVRPLMKEVFNLPSVEATPPASVSNAFTPHSVSNVASVKYSGKEKPENTTTTINKE